MTPFAAAMEVLKKLEEAGFQAYLVGGCVRDLLLHQEPADYDIATDATPDQVQAIFPDTIPTGIKHGTVTVLIHKIPLEVTTFRIEKGYSDHRRPDEVQFVSSLEADLARRDFTINAMAQDRQGKIYDPFQGRSDLERRRIRAVGHPEHRFTEDPLRIVRGIRFAAQLGFTIEPSTEAAMVTLRKMCTSLSVERVVQEIEKIWDSKNPHQGCKTFWQLGLIHFLPPFHQWDLKMKPKVEQFQELVHSSSRLIKWAYLLFLCSAPPQEARSRLRQLRLSARDTTEISQIYLLANDWPDSLTVEQGKRMILKEGIERLLAAVELAAQMDKMTKNEADFQQEQLSRWLKEMPVRKLHELAINGSNLISFTGKAPGPWVGRVLNILLERTALGDLPNEREALLEEGNRLAQSS